MTSGSKVVVAFLAMATIYIINQIFGKLEEIGFLVQLVESLVFCLLLMGSKKN